MQLDKLLLLYLSELKFYRSFATENSNQNFHFTLVFINRTDQTIIIGKRSIEYHHIVSQTEINFKFRFCLTHVLLDHFPFFWFYRYWNSASSHKSCDVR